MHKAAIAPRRVRKRSGLCGWEFIGKNYISPMSLRRRAQDTIKGNIRSPPRQAGIRFSASADADCGGLG